jgi:hypothetical protein
METSIAVATAHGTSVHVTARIHAATVPAAPCLVLAHGAGAGHDNGFMIEFASGLAARGVEAVTFNFPYTEQRRRTPDPPSVLEACWLSVAAAVRARIGERPFFIGGKSMGGRIASQVAARPEASALSLHGLVFLGYPLHPPGRPSQLRVAHWPSVRQPSLFVQGSRDTFGTPDELRAHFPSYGGRADLLVVEDGDHSFKPSKSARRGAAETYSAIQDEIARWIKEHTQHPEP